MFSACKQEPTLDLWDGTINSVSKAENGIVKIETQEVFTSAMNDVEWVPAESADAYSKDSSGNSPQNSGPLSARGTPCTYIWYPRFGSLCTDSIRPFFLSLPLLFLQSRCRD